MIEFDCGTRALAEHIAALPTYTAAQRMLLLGHRAADPPPALRSGNWGQRDAHADSVTYRAWGF